MQQILIGRKLFALSFAVVVLSVLFGIALWSWQGNLQRAQSGGENPLEGLKEFGVVPQFSFTERDGRQVTLSDLKGKVWIANFIYTNCPDTCPIQSAQMRQIQDEFKNEKELRLVSVTVDPERDTAEVLTKYAARFDAEPSKWLFLTGDKKQIHEFAQKGFQLGAAEIPHDSRPASGATHTHSPRFVLVDREAQVRGYYVSTDPEAMKRLRRDLKILLRGGE
jgi:protein SCO1/2